MARQAALYVTHGGGPMPLIGAQPDVASFLKGASKLLPQRPKAIVCVTAHWETSVPTVSTHPAPPMLYDYGGFPDEAYSIKYPAPGDPELARKILQLLRDAGFPAKEDNKRGYDHGTFVPLYLMFPKAEIPVVQVSVMSSMDPTMHVKMGEALASLRDENVLILGSGSSFHNMQLFFSRQGSHANVEGAKQAKTFDDYLNTALCSSTPEKRIEMLEKWAEAPGGQLSHPREEHLIPLHVVVGAAGQDAGKLVHQTEMNGLLCSSWVFSA